MIRWLRALTLPFLLLVVSPAIAQQSDPVRPETGAPPPPPPTDRRPPQPRPDLRDQLLRDLLDVVLQPRRPPPAEADLPAPIPSDVVPEPPPVRDAGVPMPAPEPVPPATRVPPSRPATARPTTAVPEPRPAERPIRQAPLAPPSPAVVSERVPEVAPPPDLPEAAVRAEALPSSPQVSAEPIAPPPMSEPERAPWLLLAFAAMAVAAALAAAYKIREHRRLARTKTALGLSPSLDPTAGSGSASGLSLAKPPIAIRTRLEWGAIQHG